MHTKHQGEDIKGDRYDTIAALPPFPDKYTKQAYGNLPLKNSIEEILSEDLTNSNWSAKGSHGRSMLEAKELTGLQEGNVVEVDKEEGRGDPPFPDKCNPVRGFTEEHANLVLEGIWDQGASEMRIAHLMSHSDSIFHEESEKLTPEVNSGGVVELESKKLLLHLEGGGVGAKAKRSSRVAYKSLTWGGGPRASENKNGRYVDIFAFLYPLVWDGAIGFDIEFAKHHPTREEKIIETRFGKGTAAWKSAVPRGMGPYRASPDTDRKSERGLGPRYVEDSGLMAKLAVADRYPKQVYGNLSLKTSVEEILGYELPKDLTNSNWSANTLTDNQVKLLEAEHDRKSTMIEQPIPDAWYRFNSRSGEPMRLKPSPDGVEFTWRVNDCTWYVGGKYSGWP
ncbi:hypothetical protein FB451DRAFT_1380013 [Mycena latifolia]|nr:hypothetical protein FB451DRAFT_1380013 [Mycena latifolia]